MLIYPSLSLLQAQTIKLIPNAPKMVGYLGEPYVFNGQLSIRCLKDTFQNKGQYQLGIFDGTGISLHSAPAVPVYIQDYLGSPLAYNNNLYLNYSNLYASALYEMGVYNNSTVSLLSGSDTNNIGSNYGPKIIYQRKLYFFEYYGGVNQQHLTRYDGHTITAIPNPTQKGYCDGYQIIYKNKLYFRYTDYVGSSMLVQLASFDGNSFTLYPMPAGARFTGGPFVEYHGDLYFPYTYPNNNSTIAKFDGTTVSLIPNPLNGTYEGGPIVFNDTLFLQYFVGGTHHLAKYDGSSVTVVPNPNTNAGYHEFQKFSFSVSPIIYNHKLYIVYENFGPVYQLAEYNGYGLTIFPNPDNGGGFFGQPIIYNNKLYRGYATKSHGNHLAVFDGTTTKLIPVLDSAGGLFPVPSFINYNYKLYFNNNSQLAYMDEGLPQQYITIADGNWNNPASWIGAVVPPATADVIIRHNITVTDNSICNSLKVDPNGRLDVIPGVDLAITH